MTRRIGLTMLLVGVMAVSSIADIIGIKFIDAVDKVNRGGYSAGWYKIEVSTTTGTDTYMTFCIDPLGGIAKNDSWEAVHLGMSDIIDAGILYDSDIYSNTDKATEKYAMISYLANESFYSTGLTNAERADYNAAMWLISEKYDGTQVSLSGYSNTVSALAQSALNYRNGPIDMAIYAPVNYTVNTSGARTPRSQEFLAFKIDAVPEPGLLPLLGIGLFGLFAFRRKR